MATVVKKNPTWRLRGCPKCRGDMLRDDNSYQCLQCGFIDWDSNYALPFIPSGNFEFQAGISKYRNEKGVTH
jgi:hypothetical protein